jgi:hypothetical protein
MTWLPSTAGLTREIAPSTVVLGDFVRPDNEDEPRNGRNENLLDKKGTAVAAQKNQKTGALQLRF